MTGKRLLFLFSAIIFTGCAALGTKTLYKTETKSQVKRIGFTKLDGNAIVTKIFAKTDSVFTVTCLETFKKYNLSDITDLKTELPFDNPDITTITRLCKEYNLDGLVITRLKFINIHYSVSFIPFGQSWDTDVRMKLFDSNGNLLLSVSHNTPNGNSYGGVPPAEITIRDGTKGAIKRIAKELGISK